MAGWTDRCLWVKYWIMVRVVSWVHYTSRLGFNCFTAGSGQGHTRCAERRSCGMVPHPCSTNLLAHRLQGEHLGAALEIFNSMRTDTTRSTWLTQASFVRMLSMRGPTKVQLHEWWCMLLPMMCITVDAVAKLGDFLRRIADKVYSNHLDMDRKSVAYRQS